MTPAGFPHSETSGSKLARQLPGPFAARSVLRRLLTPRHPPCALRSLTASHLRSRPKSPSSRYAVVKVRHAGGGGVSPPPPAPENRSWQEPMRPCPARGRVGALAGPTIMPDRAGRFSLRKEVIQPHVPVRLPCYDFVPVTDPTFDGSLPFGLGHRLRVEPAPMT